jgi:hypothetical protein
MKSCKDSGNRQVFYDCLNPLGPIASAKLIGTVFDGYDTLVLESIAFPCHRFFRRYNIAITAIITTTAPEIPIISGILTGAPVVPIAAARLGDGA